jgi:hypothetical protein
MSTQAIASASPRRSLRLSGLRPLALAHAWEASVWVAMLAGVGVVALSYSYAASHVSGTTHFTIFWAGMLLIVVPAALRLASESPARTERLAIVAATGLAFAIPKLLRSPGHPIFADELAHWNQTELLSRTGDPYLENPFISVVNHFPGMHTLTLALQDVAGLSTWNAALVLVFCWTMLGAAAVFLLGEELLDSQRTAGLAALVYVLNASFMFFDTQYAYESMAVPVLLWSLVIIARLQRADVGRWERARLVLFGAVLGGGLAMTHHLTALTLMAITVFIMVATWVDNQSTGEEEYLGQTAAVGALLMIEAGAWLVGAGASLTDYLLPHLSGGIDGLTRILENHGAGGRHLFGESTSPEYEKWLAFTAPAVAGALALVGLKEILKWPDRKPALTGLAAFGVLYFPSVPFVLTQGGAEGARRSWAFTYIGVALLVAVGLRVVMDAKRRSLLKRPSRRTVLVRAASPIVLPAVVSVLLIGNVAAGLSVECRFPGPFVFGSDARSLTPELRDSTAWFMKTQGIQQRMVADRASGLGFGLLGLNWSERAWSGLPLWQFYFRPEPLDGEMLTSLDYLGTTYLIVDKRTPQMLPRTGIYVNGDEPQAHRHKTPPPAAAIERYSRLPWLSRIYESDSYIVYRFDFDRLAACSDQQARGPAATRCSAS